MKTTKKVNEKLERLYKYLTDFIAENGYAPSIREMCSAVDISSTSLASFYLNKLKESGRISYLENKKRSLSLTQKQNLIKNITMLPIVGTVSAGKGMLAEEIIDGYFPYVDSFDYELDNQNVDKERFVLTVSGDSMKEAGILNGDLVVVKRQDTASNGDIVVAFWDGMATVKRYYRRENVVVLHPENSTMSDIILTYAEHPTILGKVIGCLRRYRWLKHIFFLQSTNLIQIFKLSKVSPDFFDDVDYTG